MKRWQSRGASSPEACGTREQPTEVLTLAGVIDDLRRQGFTTHLTLRNGQLRAADTGPTFSPDEVRIVAYHRFEGVSDPDDMSILYAIETRTGVRGTLADAFGVYADPRVSAFMDDVALGEALRPLRVFDERPEARGDAPRPCGPTTAIPLSPAR